MSSTWMGTSSRALSRSNSISVDLYVRCMLNIQFYSQLSLKLLPCSVGLDRNFQFSLGYLLGEI